jgi:DNA-binding GntR family transcriptional regulator
MSTENVFSFIDMAFCPETRYGRAMPSTKQPSSSLTQDAYERLRADLLACRLQPGARLKINELCQSLSISLSAVREALARLSSEGLVVAEPQRGFRAASISTDELRDLTSVRAHIEGLCLDCAIAVGDVGWESELVAAFHRLSKTPEREPSDPQRMNEAWSVAHGAYHTALVSACDSVWLLRLRAILYAQSERYRRLSVPLAAIPRDLNREHQDIMEAALAHDAERAKELMTQHLELTTRVLLEQSTLADSSAESAPRHVRKSERAINNVA